MQRACRYRLKVGGVVRERVERGDLDVGRHGGGNSVGRTSVGVPRLVEAQPQVILWAVLAGRVLALDVVSDLRPALLRMLAGVVQFADHLLPAHVGVGDAVVDRAMRRSRPPTSIRSACSAPAGFISVAVL